MRFGCICAMNESPCYAHTIEGRPEAQWQLLVAHLKGVAAEATRFARELRPADSSFADTAYWAGILHDIGKYSAEFQMYLRKLCDSSIETHHAVFGARVAADRQMLGPSFSVAGHHAGLPNAHDLQSAVRDSRYDLERRMADVCLRARGEFVNPPDRIAEPLHAENRPLGAEFYVRMLFSCLADADYLDTEAACSGRRQEAIRLCSVVDELIQRLLKERESKSREGELNSMRHAIFDKCFDKASLPPGFFTLTVPTGGGKTLAGIAFALAHAKANDLRRVIVVIPYLSIIEQNAAEYRRILDPDNLGIVIEHHSATGGVSDEDSDRSADGMTAELAAENWDAPIVITTSVQFIESLFANRPSACRKIHNIARSVVVLDEVQTLPMHLLTPLLSVLRELKEYYGVSFVFSTATQPAFRTSASLQDGFQPGEVTEIAGDADGLHQTFRTLARVRYEQAGALDWKAVAAQMVTEPRVLCVVNTRKQAFDLWETLRDALPSEDRASLFHLSSALCPAHRLDLLGTTLAPREGTIRYRLLAGLPCRVVSTQVVEAGVDLDFPVVLRAMGPLDSIVQAAGRCNREGRLPSPQKGRVIVFSPTDGGLPPGVYKTATAHTASFLANRGLSDLGVDPAEFAEYFSGLFSLTDTDYARRHECSIQEDREWLRFKDVARKARVISDDTTPVVAPYGRSKEVIETIRGRERPPGTPRYDRHDQRTLQIYTVNLRRDDFVNLQANKAIAPLLPNLDVHVLDSACYHPALGVVIDKLPTEDLCGV